MSPIVTTTALLALSNVFVPFVILYMRQPIRLDYLWAALCMPAAVWFVFRGANG